MRPFAEASFRPRRTSGHKVRVLVAVSPPALFQVIEYLFRGRPEFEIVRSLRGVVVPELIVVNVKPVSSGVCRTVQSLKRSSPGSKLILICSVKGFASSARRCGADACLEAETLIGRLLPTAQRLVKAS